MLKRAHYLIEIHECSLEQTAEVLAVINPGRTSKAHMENLVRASMWDGTTSLGTAGWEATGYFPANKPDTIVVRFSVSAYSVNKYIEAVQAAAQGATA